MNRTPVLSREDVTRFWSKVEKTEGCWLWSAGAFRGGYGQFTVRHHPYRAHRISWLITHGTWPAAECVCHSCDNPRCVRPDHLWLGTSSENTADKVDKGRQAKGEVHGLLLKERSLRGEACPASKLTRESVLEIRRRASLGEPRQDLGRAFGVTPQAIAKIVRRKAWAHV